MRNKVVGGWIKGDGAELWTLWAEGPRDDLGAEIDKLGNRMAEAALRLIENGQLKPPMPVIVDETAAADFAEMARRREEVAELLADMMANTSPNIAA